MMAFVDLDGLRAAAYACGHKLQGVILRGEFAGRQYAGLVCVSTERGDVYSFLPTHRKMRRSKSRRKATAAIRELRASAYYRWHVGPPPVPPVIEDSPAIRYARRWLGMPRRIAA